MRTLAFATSLLLAATLFAVPPASADHGPMPPAPVPTQNVECNLLPLWDATFCIANPVIDLTLDLAFWSLDVVIWADHLVRCDVVGGPPCTLILRDTDERAG